MARSLRPDRQALLGLLPLVAIAQAARKALAADVPPDRCLRCMDRPAHYAYDVFDRESRRRGPPTPEDLAPCACGFEPLYVEVVNGDPSTGERYSTAEIAAAIDAGRYDDWFYAKHPELQSRRRAR